MLTKFVQKKQAFWACGLCCCCIYANNEVYMQAAFVLEESEEVMERSVHTHML